ncbi:MAG: hypothetical protein ACO3GP_09295, partial [Candidatus Limnocylindrus sp.]
TLWRSPLRHPLPPAGNLGGSFLYFGVVVGVRKDSAHLGCLGLCFTGAEIALALGVGLGCAHGLRTIA